MVNRFAGWTHKVFFTGYGVEDRRNQEYNQAED